MITFPNCKINLGLHIVGKRDDGYHNLETVFYPLPLTDILEIIPVGSPAETLQATFSGLRIPGEPSANLCLKAWQLLKNDYPHLPPVKLHLHKHVPMGAGLGGGSSNGAFMLKLLNNYFSLGIPDVALAEYALKLGSDCPFFIYNKPVFASGRGEVFEPLAIDLERYSFLIINPGLHISTAESFSRITPSPAKIDLRMALNEPLHTWRQIITNDFEEPAFHQHAELIRIKEFLYGSGAVYASMTGTGSSFYGIFEGRDLPDCEWNSFKLLAP